MDLNDSGTTPPENKKAFNLLKESFYLWTDITINDNGEELRNPANEEEALKSKKILDEVSELTITDDEVTRRFNEQTSIVNNFLEGIEYLKTPNGKVTKLLDDMFEIWSKSWLEDGYEYRQPANDEEQNKSLNLLKQIDKIIIDDKEVIDRVINYREVLNTYEYTDLDDNTDYSDDNIDPNNKDNQIAFDLLEKIYLSWTNVTYEDDSEFRTPKNRRQIRKSRRLLKKIDKLNYTDTNLDDRFVELEMVLDEVGDAIPRYSLRYLAGTIFCVGMLAALFYLYDSPFKTPEFEYDKNLYVAANNNAKLYWSTRNDIVENKKVHHSIVLSKGTILKPIARYNKYYLQAELEDGTRGHILDTDIEGSKFVSAKIRAKVFDKIGSMDREEIPEETKATVIERVTKGKGIMSDRYIKINLEDGRTKWANAAHFEMLNFSDVPKIDKEFLFYTILKNADSLIIGSSLKQIESRYGFAKYVYKNNGKKTAYLGHLSIVDNDIYNKGVFVEFDNNGLARNLTYKEKEETGFVDSFPLLDRVREYEPHRLLSSIFFKQSILSPAWWQSFREYNMFTAIICFAVDVLVYLLLIGLFFFIPRIIITPIIQSFYFSRIFGNGIVLFLFVIIFLATSYISFIVLTFIIDGFFLASIFYFFAFLGITALFFRRISYHRCGNCKTMYSALDEGSSYTGRTSSVAWDTYQVYKGSTETDTKITKHYEQRKKSTTTETDHYLDHRTCYRCGYSWDVGREESGSFTKLY